MMISSRTSSVVTDATSSLLRTPVQHDRSTGHSESARAAGWRAASLGAGSGAARAAELQLVDLGGEPVVAAAQRGDPHQHVGDRLAAVQRDGGAAVLEGGLADQRGVV